MLIIITTIFKLIDVFIPSIEKRLQYKQKVKESIDDYYKTVTDSEKLRSDAATSRQHYRDSLKDTPPAPKP